VGTGAWCRHPGRSTSSSSLLPELAEGSMRPKVESAVDFARAGGETLITSFEALAEALEGCAGTRIG